MSMFAGPCRVYRCSNPSASHSICRECWAWITGLEKDRWHSQIAINAIEWVSLGSSRQTIRLLRTTQEEVS